MAQQNRATVATYFETSDLPTEAEFGHLLDSALFPLDDGDPIPLSGIVPPTAVTPDFVGQKYIDTVADVAYVATGLTTSDWDELLTSASGTTLTAAVMATGDSVVFFDLDDSDNPKTETVSDMITLFNAGITITESQISDLGATAVLDSDIGTTVQGYSAVLDATTASFTTADETKLDGIEALADVTDTANVTAAGALMDSEVTDLAGIKALDTTDILFADVPDQLTAGFTALIDNDGTLVTGSYGPVVADGNYKTIINGGAFTLTPPSPATGEIISLSILVINNGSAGAIITSGFTKVAGDPLTITDTHKFIFDVDVYDIGGTEYSRLIVSSLQA